MTDLTETQSPAVLAKKPVTVACPVCKKRADGRNGGFTEGIRSFQHFICDTPTCAVSSFRIEWKSP